VCWNFCYVYVEHNVNVYVAIYEWEINFKVDINCCGSVVNASLVALIVFSETCVVYCFVSNLLCFGSRQICGGSLPATRYWHNWSETIRFLVFYTKQLANQEVCGFYLDLPLCWWYLRTVQCLVQCSKLFYNSYVSKKKFLYFWPVLYWIHSWLIKMQRLGVRIVKNELGLRNSLLRAQ